MTRRTLIIIAAVAAAIFLIVYEVVSLYNTPWRPFLFLEIALLLAVLLVFFLFYYEWHVGFFFDWLTRPRSKPPDFGCVRCQSVRVIIHERREGDCIRRLFWCKDCGYEWTNIERKPPESGSGDDHPPVKRK